MEGRQNHTADESSNFTDDSSTLGRLRREKHAKLHLSKANMSEHFIQILRQKGWMWWQSRRCLRGWRVLCFYSTQIFVNVPLRTTGLFFLQALAILGGWDSSTLLSRLSQKYQKERICWNSFWGRWAAGQHFQIRLLPLKSILKYCQHPYCQQWWLDDHSADRPRYKATRYRWAAGFENLALCFVDFFSRILHWLRF